MFNDKLKIITILIVLFIFLSANGITKINNSTAYDTQSFFIIDYDVNLYRNGDSSDGIQKLNYFDPIIVLSEDVSKKGRIKVKLQNGIEGWVEEKYTSCIPKDWQKLALIDEYYCFILPELKMKFHKEESNKVRVYRYRNMYDNISMGIITFFDYKHDFKSRRNSIEREIMRGRDEKLNWNKEFTYGNYQINYIITTMHHDGDISESFDFIKLDEMNLKKYYFVTVDYSPDASAEKKLIQRKILFTALQSLR